MRDKIIIEKNTEKETKVPSLWRNIFVSIVEGLKEKNYLKVKNINGLESFSIEDMNEIVANIEDYNAHLISLPEESWHTSVCQWMEGYWDILIDLYTIEEGASDLVLAVKVYETNSSYTFKIQGVYVP